MRKSSVCFSFFVLIFFFINNIITYASAIDGLKTINVYVKDKAGNIQIIPISSNITLDRELPVINIDNPNMDIYAKTKNISASIVENNLKNISYEIIDSSTACNGLINFTQEYISGENILLNNENLNGKKVCFKAEDLAGNISYLNSLEIKKIDHTAPTIQVLFTNEHGEEILDNTPTTYESISPLVSDVDENIITSYAQIDKNITYSDAADCSAASYNNYSNPLIFTDTIDDNGKQICFKAEDSAGNVNYNLVTVIMNSLPTMESITSDSNFINIENEESFNFKVNKIQDNDNEEIIIYYSWDNINYSELSRVQNTNISKDYNFNINSTSIPQGENSLYLKLFDGNFYSGVRYINIFKDTIYPEISINNPDFSFDEQFKNISAVMNDSNNIVDSTYSFINPSEVCNFDNSLDNEYISGENILLNNENLNGKKICFRTEDSYGNEKFLESDVISGIDTTPPVTPSDFIINEGNAFTNESTITLNIIHPDETDVSEWCVTQDNDFNSCTWVKVKPTTYEINK